LEEFESKFESDQASRHTVTATNSPMTATRAAAAPEQLPAKEQNPAVLFDVLIRESKDPKYFKNF
jgi:hypothetical protein